jgi:hypothetical protein
MPKAKQVDPAEVRERLADIGRRRAARPSREEITRACLDAKAAGIQVIEMAELTGIQRQWLHKRHLEA